MNKKPVYPYWQAFLFQWKHASVYYLILQLLFIWTHWASLLFNSAAGEKISLKRKEVGLRPAESLAKGPGIVLVAPVTLKQLSDVTCCLPPLWCLPARPRSGVSIGWAVDYLLPEDTKTKPNPNLGLDLRGETHPSSSPTVWYSLLYNPL